MSTPSPAKRGMCTPSSEEHPDHIRPLDHPPPTPPRPTRHTPTRPPTRRPPHPPSSRNSPSQQSRLAQAESLGARITRASCRTVSRASLWPAARQVGDSCSSVRLAHFLAACIGLQCLKRVACLDWLHEFYLTLDLVLTHLRQYFYFVTNLSSKLDLLILEGSTLKSTSEMTPYLQVGTSGRKPRYTQPKSPNPKKLPLPPRSWPRSSTQQLIRHRHSRS